MTTAWRNCGVCKKEISLGKTYQKCSISTCRKNVFCSVDCWSIHDSVMGHKSAYAEEETAPSSVENHSSDQPRRRIVVSGKPSSPVNSDLPQDVLIVVSKLKNYVKAKSSMNTSGDVADELSKYVRILVNQAIDNAREDGRKTVMAKDFKNLSL